LAASAVASRAIPALALICCRSSGWMRRLEHHPDACRHCGTLLQGADPAPVRHQVLEIPPITPLVIEHRLHRLVCPCCSTTTCATLPPDVESSRYGPRLSGLVGRLGSAFPLSISKSQALLQQLLGLTISRGMTPPAMP
jgi:transposase